MEMAYFTLLGVLLEERDLTPMHAVPPPIFVSSSSTPPFLSFPFVWFGHCLQHLKAFFFQKKKKHLVLFGFFFREKILLR